MRPARSLWATGYLFWRVKIGQTDGTILVGLVRVAELADATDLKSVGLRRP